MLSRVLPGLLLWMGTAFSAGLPDRVLAGYWQNWSDMALTEIDPAYNVVLLAFATTRPGSDCDLEFKLPAGMQSSRFLEDLSTLKARGTRVILSVGGAADPIRLTSDAERDRFVTSLDSLLVAYQDAIDGVDLDFESTSMDFGPWTLRTPAAGQTRIVEAIEAVMSRYRGRTGRKLLLTMAPELIYLQGALSRWQVDNANGGAWLPVIEGLRDSIDLLMPQFYNAGGASGGIFARDGRVWYDTGDPDFITAMTETVLLGFELLDGRGRFEGFSADRFAVGVPASSCEAAGTGFVDPRRLVSALAYLRGDGERLSSYTYATTASHPSLRGVMTWSLNLDASSCDGPWAFARALEGRLGPVEAGRRARPGSSALPVGTDPDLLGRNLPGVWSRFVQQVSGHRSGSISPR